MRRIAIWMLIGMSITAVSHAATCNVIMPELWKGRISVPYEGECANGMANGRGKYAVTYGDNSILTTEYTGQFRDGKLNGRSEIVESGPIGTSKGEGEFLNNQRHGSHKMTGPDGLVSSMTYVNGRVSSGVSQQTVRGTRVARRFENGKEVVICRSDQQQEIACTPAERQALLGVGANQQGAAHAQATVQDSPASSTSRGDGPRLVPLLRCGADKDMYAGVRPSTVGIVIAYFDKAGGILESHEKVENAMRALISPTKQLTGCTSRADSIQILGMYEGEEQKCSTANRLFDRVNCLTGGFSRDAAVARAVLKKDEQNSSMSDLFWSTAVDKNKVAVENARRDAARAQQQQAEKARVDARHQATLAADKKAQAFADKHSVRGWLKYESLKANPFALEGQVYMFSSKLYEMKKATEGLFAGDIYIVDIPRGTFVDKSEFIIAGKVEGTALVRTPLGTEAQLPKIRYLGSEKCSMSQCQDFGAIRR